ncbi:MAG TPA: VacJ family lipoprotein [Myxococcota bacterium]|nr:VacJ family lipoprotein [Myxococcota bacterium]
MSRVRRGLAGLACLGLLAAGAPPAAAADPADPAAAPAPDVEDPWEAFNRPIFRFNDFLARNALEPVGRGWAWLMPEPVRDAIARVFVNARTPAVMVNHLLQGEPTLAGRHLGRFLVNSTLGIGGLFDPAAASGVPYTEADFGQTFGVWGVPPGPYLVLPLLGPSSPRDAVGRAADAAAVPYGYVALPFWVTLSIGALDQVNDFSFTYEDIATERAAAFDWYAAVRNAWVSRRAALVRGDARAAVTPAQEEEEEELYLPDEEFDE